MEQEKYIPGVCNIGPKERQSRLISGILGFAIGGIIMLVILALKLNPLLLLISWGLFFAGFMGYYQYSLHFCAQFGIRGVFNINNAIGNTTSVQNKEFAIQDRQKAIKIIIYSFLSASGIVFIAEVILFFLILGFI